MLQKTEKVKQLADNFCPTKGYNRPSRMQNRRGIINGIKDGLSRKYDSEKADGIYEDSWFAEGYRRGNATGIDYLVTKGEMSPEEFESFYNGGPLETEIRESVAHWEDRQFIGA